MTNYKQLGQEQRYVIDRLLMQGKSQSEIADVLGYHKSTISRELNRNTPKRGIGAKEYNPQRAQLKAERRHKEKNKQIIFTDEMRKRIVKQLAVEKLSPELITQVGRKDNPDFISHETMTYDNDLAFALHTTVNKELQTKSFFTHPYTSQEKGTVENRIGVLRRFFPKKTDFTLVTAKRVSQVEKMINERPVRKFNYQTPNAVFLRKLKVALIT
jgi:IS30 family transposase